MSQILAAKSFHQEFSEKSLKIVQFSNKWLHAPELPIENTSSNGNNPEYVKLLKHTAAWINYYKKKEGLSDRQIGEKIGITASSVCKIRGQKMAYFKLTTLIGFTVIFNDSLVNWLESMPPEI